VKHFPGDVDPERKPWWAARHKLDKNKSYVVSGVETAECPVSLITAESLQLLEMVTSSNLTKESSGAALFGPNTSRWPAWWHDAVVVVALQERAEQAARMEAMNAGH
jgi:hypothetical protein